MSIHGMMEIEPKSSRNEKTPKSHNMVYSSAVDKAHRPKRSSPRSKNELLIDVDCRAIRDQIYGAKGVSLTFMAQSGAYNASQNKHLHDLERVASFVKNAFRLVMDIHGVAPADRLLCELGIFGSVLAQMVEIPIGGADTIQWEDLRARPWADQCEYDMTSYRLPPTKEYVARVREELLERGLATRPI